MTTDERKRSRRPRGNCEAHNCGRKRVAVIHVDEIQGDGAFRIGVCLRCAKKLKLNDGDTV